jgi:hypothetical protein
VGGSNVKAKSYGKKNSLEVVSSSARLNHHFNNEETSNQHHYHSIQKYGAGVSSFNPLAERNNSSFDNHT